MSKLTEEKIAMYTAIAEKLGTTLAAAAEPYRPNITVHDGMRILIRMVCNGLVNMPGGTGENFPWFMDTLAADLNMLSSGEIQCAAGTIGDGGEDPPVKKYDA